MCTGIVSVSFVATTGDALCQDCDFQEITFILFLFVCLTDVMENLHTAAYRDTLGRSLYTPEFMISKFNPQILNDYVKSRFTAENMALVGIGQYLLSRISNYYIPANCRYIIGNVPILPKKKRRKKKTGKKE